MKTPNQSTATSRHAFLKTSLAVLSVATINPFAGAAEPREADIAINQLG